MASAEAEVNGVSKSTNERGPSLGGSMACRMHVVQVQVIFFSALAALVGPVQNIFLLTVHYFNSFVLLAQQNNLHPFGIKL